MITSKTLRWSLPLIAGIVALTLQRCGGGSSSTSTGGSCDNSIGWQDATSHEGQATTVKGPVVGATYRPDVYSGPTFLDIGASYPDSSRLSVVIWQENRSKFNPAPEDQ